MGTFPKRREVAELGMGRQGVTGCRRDRFHRQGGVADPQSSRRFLPP
jgi:hypothetical protein